MSVSQEYLDWLMERLEPLGGVSRRRMFGGAGLFRDGAMFALIIGDTVYLKSDEQSAAVYDAEDCAPFTYSKQGGQTVVTALRRCPDEAFDDDEILLDWARVAMDASQRAAAKKPKKKKRPL